jgi:cytochrome b561
MSLKSTSTRYGAVAIAIHWLTALAIFGLLASGLVAANTGDAAQEIALLRGHAVMGVLVLVLTLMRILWWWLIDRLPAEMPGPVWQQRAARVVHGLLYVVILVMAVSGLAMIALSGAGNILFGGAAPPLPDFWTYPPRFGHAVAARLMLVLLVGHIGAALLHQFVLRDRLLARMGLGRAA